MKAIGIDIGTTTISLVVMDLTKKEVIEAKTIPNASFIDGKPWEKIQDADRLTERAKTLVDEAIGKYPDARAIGLTGQMHGGVYTDCDGHAVSPLYTWEDETAGQPIEAADEATIAQAAGADGKSDGESGAAAGAGGKSDGESGDAAARKESRSAEAVSAAGVEGNLAAGKNIVTMIREKYGLPAATGFACLTYLYHVKTGAVPERAVKVCTIPDYLGMVLTGRKSPLTHVSNAASMGLFDSEKLVFRTQVLEAEGGNPDFLPDVTRQIEVLGTYRGLPVTVALGDNQASFLGAVGSAKEVWQVNVGTGSQICVLSERFFEAPGVESRPYLEGKYILTGAPLCGGRAYALLENFFRQYMQAAGSKAGEQYGTLAQLLKEAPEDADGLEVNTLFSGTRLDPQLRGSITGISVENFTPQNLAIGFVNGIVEELYQIYRKIYSGTGIEAKQLMASGNGVRLNPYMQRRFEKRFQAQLTLSQFKEEAASGAALSTEYVL